MGIAVVADETSRAFTAAAPTGTTCMIVIDVHGPQIRMGRPANRAYVLLKPAQLVNELHGHVVVTEADPRCVAWLAVRPGSAQCVDRRVVGYGLVLAAPQALDEPALDHHLDGTVGSLLAQRRERSALALLLVVAGAELSGSRCAATSDGRQVPAAAHVPTRPPVTRRHTIRSTSRPNMRNAHERLRVQPVAPGVSKDRAKSASVRKSSSRRPMRGLTWCRSPGPWWWVVTYAWSRSLCSSSTQAKGRPLA